LARVKVKLIGLVAIEECVFCGILVEHKRSNLFALLSITILCTRPDLAVQCATARVFSVPSPRGFVRVVGNDCASRVKVGVEEAGRIAWAVDISILATWFRRHFGWHGRYS
jgi:hypothetical protein